MMIEKVKGNYKYIIAFVLGVLISSIGVCAETILSSNEVFYDNSKSASSSNNVQGAIDELYEKPYSCSNTKFLAYTYNQTAGASNYCVTGHEPSCVKTDCYKNKSAGSCAPNTIIRYQVNDSKKVWFHVLHDDGKTITMQHRANTVRNTAWNTSDDISKGPITILSALESATSSWTNVEDQEYEMGTTNFNATNSYTGCSHSGDYKLNCTTNLYTLGKRTAKARLITVQEATSLGCLERNYDDVSMNSNSCPLWMSNFLYQSAELGSILSDDSVDSITGNYLNGYWTMSTKPSNMLPYTITRYGDLISAQPASNITYFGARAVVVVSK